MRREEGRGRGQGEGRGKGGEVDSEWSGMELNGMEDVSERLV